MQIGELKVRLGVDSDVFKVKDFVHAIGQIPFSVAAGITALTGMSFAVTDLLKNTLGLADNLRIFTSVTGESGTELQKWTSVAKQLGIDTNAVQGSVMGLVKTFSQFKITGNVNEGFLLGLAKLGMGFDPNKDPFTMMREALVRANSMKNKATAAEALSMMQIDPALMQMGALSDKQFNKMAIVTLDESGIAAMKDFREALEKMDFKILQALTSSLVSATPMMSKLAESISELVTTLAPLLIKGTVKEISNISNLVGWAKGGSQWKDVIEGFSRGLDYRPPHGWGGTLARGSTMHITNNIHSNGDAFAVANVVNEFTARYHRKAVSAFNNGGQ